MGERNPRILDQNLEKFGTKEGDIENREVFRNNCGL